MKSLLIALFVAVVVHSASLAADVPVPMKPGQGVLTSVNINDIREFDSRELLKKTPIDTGKLVFNTYFLEPRQVLRFQKHPAADELFFVVEGRGQFVVGNTDVMVDSGSAVFGPANVPHGIVNSGNSRLVMLSVQALGPEQTTIIENSSAICTVCGQENIVPEGAKIGDIIMCPRCHAKLKLSKTKDGKWQAVQA